MSLETKVKTIQGDFRRASEFAEGTWQSSAEITKDMITKKSLREEIKYKHMEDTKKINGSVLIMVVISLIIGFPRTSLLFCITKGFVNTCIVVFFLFLSFKL